MRKSLEAKRRSKRKEKFWISPFCFPNDKSFSKKPQKACKRNLAAEKRKKIVFELFGQGFDGAEQNKNCTRALPGMLWKIPNQVNSKHKQESRTEGEMEMERNKNRFGRKERRKGRQKRCGRKIDECQIKRQNWGSKSPLSDLLPDSLSDSANLQMCGQLKIWSANKEMSYHCISGMPLIRHWAVTDSGMPPKNSEAFFLFDLAEIKTLFAIVSIQCSGTLFFAVK